jgi:hypothetical protein
MTESICASIEIVFRFSHNADVHAFQHVSRADDVCAASTE